MNSCTPGGEVVVQQLAKTIHSIARNDRDLENEASLPNSCLTRGQRRTNTRLSPSAGLSALRHLTMLARWRFSSSRSIESIYHARMTHPYGPAALVDALSPQG